MAQKLNLPGFGSGSGIVVVLFLMGTAMKIWNLDPEGGILAIRAATVLAFIYGFLGIVGMLINFDKRSHR